MQKRAQSSDDLARDGRGGRTQNRCRVWPNRPFGERSGGGVCQYLARALYASSSCSVASTFARN